MIGDDDDDDGGGGGGGGWSGTCVAYKSVSADTRARVVWFGAAVISYKFRY